MMTRTLALATALAVVLSSQAQATDRKAVTIGTEGSYEPWNVTKPDGSLDGFEVELAKDLCARAKLECRFVTQDWDGMIAGLKAGKFDVIMDALSVTPERKDVMAFTVPYAATPAGFAVSKTGPLADMPGTGTTVTLAGQADAKAVVAPLRAALKGRTIGIQSATVYAKFVYDNFQDVATIREYKTPAEHDLDLAAGRIDAAFDDATYFTSAMAKPDNADLAFSGPAIAGAIWGEGEALGLRKSDADLGSRFDAAIKAALADGTVSRISVRYFGLDVAPR